MGKLDRVLRLVHLLAESSDGLTLDEMARDLGVNRRTVERMRDIVLLHFDLEEVLDGRQKRFRISESLRRVYTRPTAAEVAALSAEIELLAAAGHHAQAAPLQGLLRKIRGALDRNEKRRIDPDFEVLTRLQRVAFEAGRRSGATSEVMGLIQQAMLEGRCVEFSYGRDSWEKPQWRRVIPYGLIHGPSAYLVGKMPGSERGPVYFLLERMEDVRLSELAGVPEDAWNLDAWLAENFSIWRDDEAHDVLLRVMPGGVGRARNWVFHPDQRVVEDGGELLVHFRSGGLRALAEHLFSWGDTVRIENPAPLREELLRQLECCRRALADATTNAEA